MSKYSFSCQQLTNLDRRIKCLDKQSSGQGRFHHYDYWGFGSYPGPPAFAVKPAKISRQLCHHHDVKKVQESLRDKGYYNGKIDGLVGPEPEKRFGSIRSLRISLSPDTLMLKRPANSELARESVRQFEDAGQEIGKGGRVRPRDEEG